MKTLFIITGPTAVGKTEISLRLAERLGSPIVGADSRQIYQSIPIGTAAPTAEEQARVRHYFVGTRAICHDYSAAQYETDCLALLEKLFLSHGAIVVSGGSSLYIDALRHGIDNIPSISDAIRQNLQGRLQSEGLAPLCQELSRSDPEHYAVVDRNNPRRVIHALEVCLQTGRPYSSFLQHHGAVRPFRIIVVALCLPQEELYERINARVDAMIGQGLEAEARAMLPFRGQNALNTVGYKEMFEYFDGSVSRRQAIENIKSHTRAYARKQLTWLRRDNAAVWFSARHADDVIRFACDICA